MYNCLICNKSFERKRSFSAHIVHTHKITTKQYYDLNIKSPTEGLCVICGKPTKFNSLEKGYRRCCSSICSNLDPNKMEKIKQTCLKKYGVDNPWKSTVIKEKIKQSNLEKYGVEYYTQTDEYLKQLKNTCLEKYGVDNPNKAEEVKEKQRNTLLKNYGVDSPAKSSIILEKMQTTCLQKYGVKNPSSNEEIKRKKTKTFLEKYGVSTYTQTDQYNEKRKQTCLEKYGVSDLNQAEEVKEKQRNTLLKNYGVDNPSKSQIIRERQRKTCLEKYGKEFYTQTDEYLKQLKNTCLEKYGVDHFMYVAEIRKKIFKKYKINNVYYDSKWEYLYEQYLIQNNIKYEYHPDIYFEYNFNGKTHRYFPDFIVYYSDTEFDIIDIKGDHLLKNMINNENIKEHAKYLCMLKNNVKLLIKQDLINLGIKL